MVRICALLLAAVLPSCSGYAIKHPGKALGLTSLRSAGEPSGDDNGNAPASTGTLSYEDSDAASKGLVSSLTDWVNTFAEFGRNKEAVNGDDPRARLMAYYDALPPPPSDSGELLQRIKQDYTEHNYLWTGKLDLNCFDESCRFTDPTLSFVGLDAYKENIANLVPIVENNCRESESVLLSARVVEFDEMSTDKNSAFDDRDEAQLRSNADGFVETRWNMVGNIESPWLFWRPRVDVIGRTKFWFRKSRGSDGNKYQIYFYDEAWEMPAAKALLQLVTPAGTITSSK